jgi:hypothetical protein
MSKEKAQRDNPSGFSFSHDNHITFRMCKTMQNSEKSVQSSAKFFSESKEKDRRCGGRFCMVVVIVELQSGLRGTFRKGSGTSLQSHQRLRRKHPTPCNLQASKTSLSSS